MPTNYNGYTVPEPTDIADAPAAFEQFSDSIPFSEYVAIESLSADTTVDDSYNGKMIFATADLTLTFGTLDDGFSVAVTADTGVTVDYLGVDKESQQTTAYQVATVVAVNGTNIISIAGGGSTPCPPCPPAGTPEATITAITGSGITHTYGDFVAFEFLHTDGSLTCTEGTFVDLLTVGGGGAGAGTNGGGGGAGGRNVFSDYYFGAATHPVTVGDGGLGVYNRYGTNGGQSSIGPVIGIGGGAGMGGPYGGFGRPNEGLPGMDGGCGGGSKGSPNAGDEALGGSPSQAGGGFAGGGNVVGAGYPSGGGGGLGSVGETSTMSASGNGGSPLSLSITGEDVEYGGGGGGGAGTATPGAGGGAGAGDGSNSGNGASASIPNRGSGGGGGGNVTTGGDGSSGVVIVKVKASNAANVDKSGWTEVTPAMLAAAAKKREVERKAEAKKLEKKLALEAKNAELSGQTNKTDIKENK